MDFTPAITALMTGGLQGYDKGREWKKQDAELAKNKAALVGDGFDESGNVDESFFDENSPSYKRAKQAQLFKAMGTAKAAPTANPLTIRQVHQMRGIPLPPELESQGDNPFDHRYASVLPQLEKKGPTLAAGILNDPTKADPEMQIPAQFAGNFKKSPTSMQAPLDISQYANDPIVKKYGFTPEQLRAIPANHPIVDTLKYINRPQRPGQELVDDTQALAFEQATGAPAGSGKGITKGAFASVMGQAGGQRQAMERLAANNAYQDDRLNKRLGVTESLANKAAARQERQFTESKNLDREKAVLDPVTEIETKLGKLGRLGDYIDSAQKMNMNYKDYLKLSAQSKGANVLGSFGSDKLKLSPEEEARLGKYSEIGGGFVSDLFSSGGKQLTEIEKQLISKFEIQPGDDASQIRAKGAGLTDYLESDFAAKISAIERINPATAAELRAKAAQEISGVRQYFLNASGKRASGAKVGEPVTKDAITSGQKLGIGADKLAAIRQMPTKGVAQSAPAVGAKKVIGGKTYVRGPEGWIEQ